MELQVGKTYLVLPLALDHSPHAIQASSALCTRRVVHCGRTSRSKAALGHI